jgi:outer membrane protein TolC
MTTSHLKRAAIPLLAVLLGGCASFSSDGGLSTARNIAADELGKEILKVSTQAEAHTAQARVEDLLRRPLTPDSAVQVALLKNRGLQAAFADLGVAEAVYVQASLPPAPKFSLARLGGSLELEIERQILVGLFEIATLPARAAIAERRFEAARYRTAEAVLRLGLESRRQYHRTVAANQQVAYLQQALKAAESASILARQLGETGALNKLEQAREQAFFQELGAQLARARIEQMSERERLIRQLGLFGRDIEFRLPHALPPLPAKLATGREIERRARERRVDLLAMRTELDALAGQHGLSGATRFLNDFEVMGLWNTERGKSVSIAAGGDLDVEREKVSRRGLEIEFQIPVSDFGATAIRNAEQTYMAAANRLAERAVLIRSEAREAYLRYRGMHDLARHYQSRVLPLRKTIQDESLLHYSGMLVDVATLITDSRARILSNVDAINARRDFWIAATDLKAALVGGGVGGGGGGATASPAAAGGGEAPGH